MTITIVFSPPHEERGDPSPEIARILARAPAKITRILARSPSCVCNSPEDDDVLRDSNGNVVGTIEVVGA